MCLFLHACLSFALIKVCLSGQLSWQLDDVRLKRNWLSEKKVVARASHSVFSSFACLSLSVTRFGFNWMDNNNWHIKWLRQILISFRLLKMDRRKGLKLTMKMFYFSPFDSSASAKKTTKIIYARILYVCVHSMFSLLNNDRTKRSTTRSVCCVICILIM